ncbi:MAG: folylpolyglutamate synthase/dihydrofolate synthase family protein, partial [Acidobacteriaceae bacterium]
MSYTAALESLHARASELHTPPGEQRRKFRLEEMRALAAALGHPERRFRSVLIAGTNGKGSTAATLSAILNAAGYKTGLYTSPHLTRVNERIRIAGQPLSDDDFARHYFRVDDCAARLAASGALPAHPSFFESLTALAFEAFAEAQVDLAVLEVGMGGRLDATNIVDPLVSVITDISLDHMEWLGDTIPLIAREKAGILRPGGVLVTLPQHPQANQVIGEVATELNVRAVSAADYVPMQIPRKDEADPAEDSVLKGHGFSRAEKSPETTEALAPVGQSSPLRNQYPLTVLGEQILVDSPLGGIHQQRNLALAIAAAVELSTHHGYKITPAHIAEGIRGTRWPGRLERFSFPGKADVLLDVAHNPAGAWALRAAVSALTSDQSTLHPVLVFGCMKDKAFDEMARILFPLFNRIFVVPVPSPRSASVDDLLAAA